MENDIMVEINRLIRNNDTKLEQKSDLLGIYKSKGHNNEIILDIKARNKTTKEVVLDRFIISVKDIDKEFGIGEFDLNLRYQNSVNIIESEPGALFEINGEEIHSNVSEPMRKIKIKDNRVDKLNKEYLIIDLPTVNHLAVNKNDDTVVNHTMGIPFCSDIRKSKYIYSKTLHEELINNKRIVTLYFGPFVIETYIDLEGNLNLK